MIAQLINLNVEDVQKKSGQKSVDLEVRRIFLQILLHGSPTPTHTIRYVDPMGFDR